MASSWLASALSSGVRKSATMAPAKKAPTMISIPSFSARTTKINKVEKAARTLICAVAWLSSWMILCNDSIRLKNEPNLAAKKNATNSKKTRRISAVKPREITATSTLIKNMVTKSAMTVASKIVCP